MARRVNALEQPSWDGKKHTQLGHGRDCVLLVIHEEHGATGSIVLDADGAEQLGRNLIRQARLSREAG